MRWQNKRESDNIEDRENMLDVGDLETALNATEAIGYDRLQNRGKVLIMETRANVIPFHAS